MNDLRSRIRLELQNNPRGLRVEKLAAKLGAKLAQSKPAALMKQRAQKDAELERQQEWEDCKEWTLELYRNRLELERLLELQANKLEAQ